MEYEELRESLLASGSEYKDEEFPPCNSSIDPKCDKEYEWLRPKDICEKIDEGLKPKFIVDGADRSDLIQGDAKDCWVIVACAGITQNLSTFKKVVPEDQSFDDEEYCGAFHFRFWRFGKWESVIVDDYLPIKYDDDDKPELIFAHSNVKNEFWGALLEKAYAKLHGSYQALDEGSVADGLTDFTGGLVEQCHLSRDKTVLPDIPDLLFKSFEKNSFAIASINQPSMLRTKLENGLVANHAYNITGIEKITLAHDEIILLRLRNPWGGDVEWNGNWSDSSDKWNLVSDALKSKMDYNSKKDGEFWMEYSEFTRYFQAVHICHQIDLEDTTDSTSSTWTKLSVELDMPAGKSEDDEYSQEEFGIHRQIPLETEETDKDILIDVMQKNRIAGTDNLTISFRVYEIPQDMDIPIELDYLLNEKPIQGIFRRAGMSCKARSLSDRFRLKKRLKLVLLVYFPGVHKSEEVRSIFIRIIS